MEQTSTLFSNIMKDVLFILLIVRIVSSDI